MRTLIPLSMLGAVLLLGAPASAVVTIDWTFVGNPGNAADNTGFGAVGYGYNIGTYEVTNAQYAEFLNAVAAAGQADPNALYSTSMDSGLGGITRTVIGPDYSYAAIAFREDMPVNYVSFYDAARFANWLHNGQLTGAQDNTTTEDGAYTFSGPTTVGARNAGATIFLPSEDEWYKAAFYSPPSTSYFDYPAGSDTQTTCSAPTAAANSANCASAAGELTIVGSYPGSPSPYGTFDQGGNVYEWNEAIISGDRGIRSGAYFSGAINLAATSGLGFDPTSGIDAIGIRVAPEPGKDLLLVAGVLGVFGLAGWRRARA